MRREKTLDREDGREKGRMEGEVRVCENNLLGARHFPRLEIRHRDYVHVRMSATGIGSAYH